MLPDQVSNPGPLTYDSGALPIAMSVCNLAKNCVNNRFWYYPYTANLDYSRARAYCACSRGGWGLCGHFFLLPIFSLFFLPLW